ERPDPTGPGGLGLLSHPGPANRHDAALPEVRRDQGVVRDVLQGYLQPCQVVPADQRVILDQDVKVGPRVVHLPGFPGHRPHPVTIPARGAERVPEDRDLPVQAVRQLLHKLGPVGVGHYGRADLHRYPYLSASSATSRVTSGRTRLASSAQVNSGCCEVWVAGGRTSSRAFGLITWAIWAMSSGTTSSTRSM